MEGADLAPSSIRTRQGRNSPIRSAAHPIQEPLPAELLTFQPASAFELSERKFSKNLQSFSRCAALGPSGMFAEHFRPVLEALRVLHSFFRAAEFLEMAQVPKKWWRVAVGADYGFPEPTGGVRGIVVGDIFRRLVGRTMSHITFSVLVEFAAACECVAHALQALCETDPQSTVLSIRGSARSSVRFDFARHHDAGLREVNEEALFMRVFYGQPSTHLWKTMTTLSIQFHRVREEMERSFDAFAFLLWPAPGIARSGGPVARW